MLSKAARIAAAALLVASFAPGVRTVHITLTTANFDAETSGKATFVKFHAPWCGHCKRVKPVWQEVGNFYASKSDTVIGDVDCTHPDSQDLCTKFGVRGFPTFKYFTDATDVFGAKYEGDRTFEGFKQVVETYLGPGCGVNHMDKCSPEQKESIDVYLAMDIEHRKEKVNELQKLINEEEESWKEKTDQLQKDYEDMGMNRNPGIVHELQSKYQQLTMQRDAVVQMYKPRLRLLMGVMRDGNSRQREEEF